MADAALPPQPDPDPRLGPAVQAAQLRAFLRRTGLVFGASALAGALAVLVLPMRAPGAGIAWLALLCAVLAARQALAHHCRGAGAAAGTLLARMRSATLLHGAAWGALAWVTALPADTETLAMLILIQVGVAVGGMALLLFDRATALAFAAVIVLPLALRVVALPGPAPALAGVAAAMFLLLSAVLAVAAQLAARVRMQLAATRLAESDRQAEKQRVDRLMRQGFDHSGEGLCIYDADLVVQAANRRIAEMLSLDPALIQPGTPMRAWIEAMARRGEYGEVAPAAEVERRVAELREPVRAVARRTLADGRTLETRRTPLPEGGSVIVCVDVTESEASAAALFENRRTLDVLLQQTEEGFWFIDNALRTTDANDAMCRMLGVTREQLLGRTIYEFVDEENAEVFRRQVALRQQGRAGTYEIALTRADGGRVYCVNNATPIHDAEGRKIGAIGLFSDVSAQRQAQAELRESESRFRRLADSAPAFIWLSDAEGRPEWFNQAWLALTGHGLAQMLAESWSVRVHADDQERCRAVFYGAFARREPYTVEFRVLAGDGRVVWIADHGVPRFTEQGRFEGFVCHGWDITAHRAAEQALTAARDEAERANRAKSDFLSRMSHELRTPLNAILGFGQLLQHDVAEPLSAGQRGRVAQIVSGGRHLLTLINEVLDLARIEAGALPLDLAPVAVDAVVDDCLRLIAPAARERGLQLRHDGAAAGSAIADATRLRQVLLNLLSNAVKYNRPGGTVQVTASMREAWLRLEVRDEGPGLDAEQQARLFQAFERLDADRSAVEGAGIGLALSRSLMALMQGRIGVESTPGAGSVFWIELPRAAAPAHAPQPSPQPSPQPVPQPVPSPEGGRGGGRRVLYIEDNEVNQLLMQGMFALRPTLVLELADEPRRGLALARAAPPDLVLLDVQLPGMSGYEVLSALRADPATRDVPVIGVSANAMPRDVDAARAAGFDDYLTKPVDLGRLLALLDRWLAADTATG